MYKLLKMFQNLLKLLSHLMVLLFFMLFCLVLTCLKLWYSVQACLISELLALTGFVVEVFLLW